MSITLAKPDDLLRGRRSWTLFGMTLALLIGAAADGFAQETATARHNAPLRPVAVWPTGPLEVIAAFDSPVDPAAAKAMIERTIPYHDTDGTRPAAPPPSKP